MLESDSAASIRDVLDRAIADVAKMEYARLTVGMDLEGRKQHVDGALESLKDLGRGGKPYYDEWIALFYLTWHQPRHIHLASLVSHIFGDFRPTSATTGGREGQNPVATAS